MTVKQLYEWAVKNGAADCEMVTTLPNSYVPYAIGSVAPFSPGIIELKTTGSIAMAINVKKINEEVADERSDSKWPD